MAAGDTQSEIRAVLDGMIEAINAGDGNRLRTFLSLRSGSVHIGSDDTEWLTDDQLVQSLGNGDAAGIKAVIDDWAIHGGESGVAWAIGRGHFQDRSRRTPTVRLTAVLTREGDRWVVVHSHASIGVPNEKMFG